MTKLISALLLALSGAILLLWVALPNGGDAPLRATMKLAAGVWTQAGDLPAEPSAPADPDAPFRVLDTFDQLSDGPINGRNGWTATAEVAVIADPIDDTNQVLRLEISVQDAHKALANPIDDGDQGTLFFRMRRQTEQAVWAGIADAPAPAATTDLIVQTGHSNFTPGPFFFRDGDSMLASDQAFGENIWYCVWLALDNQANTYEAYVQGGAFTNATRLSRNGNTTFDFFANLANPLEENALVTFSLWGGDGAASDTAWFDDIYVDPDSINLINPSDNPCSPPPPDPCNPLTLSHSGEGADPVAAPSRSQSCALGEYLFNETIALTAAPATGWRVLGWSGTDDNSSISTTNTLTMPARPAGVNVTYELRCYTLTLSHTGDGADPAAQPDRSAGCGAGQYLADEKISFTAAPAPGWRVASWSGTDDNRSTGISNTLTMPAANAFVGVAYEPLCYPLTLGHTGSGADPIATPTRSTGCAQGRYSVGEIIALTANPAAGWRVQRWSGTDDDDSTGVGNLLTMPARNANVLVEYEPACYLLTTAHTGEGADPIPSPASSPSCAVGEYQAATVVTLTANPAAGWEVARWSGTDDDAANALENQVTMPAADVTARVIYTPIGGITYSLTVTTAGDGAVVKAPDKEAYAAGETVLLTATPDPGWQFSGWRGDADGAENPYTLIMDADKVVEAAFTEVVPCYELTRRHSGEGADPVAAPPGSPGCDDNAYRAGETILLTAQPAQGWRTVGWNGTNNDAAAANQNSLIMPAGARTVIALYLPEADSDFRTAFLPIIDRARPPSPFPQLSNGAFDDAGSSAWSERSTSGLDLIVTEQYVTAAIGQPFSAQTPPNLAWLGGKVNESAALAQIIALPDDISDVRVSFYQWIAARESSCGDDQAFVQLGDTILRTFDLCRSSNTGAWQRIELSLAAHAGSTAALTFRLEQDGDELSNWYIDSVRLCDGSNAQPCE